MEPGVNKAGMNNWYNQMSSQAPLVSIGVPNYNYAHFIVDALNSIVSQDYTNIELIIVDDLSTDNSIAVIEEWISNYKGDVKIIFLKNSINVGITKVCNHILKSASGKYIQFLDADDLILPQKIKTQVVLMEADNNAALVYSDVLLIDDKGEIFGNGYLNRIGYDRASMPSGNIHEFLFDFNFIPSPSVLVRSEMVRKAGDFDETLGLQDYYLWLKLTEQYKAIYLPESTAMYRVHVNSLSNSLLTSPRLTDSTLTMNFRYYQNASKIIRKKIKKTIHGSAANLYKLRYPTAGKWLRADFLLNPGFKTGLYYLGNMVGIPYSFFEKIKSGFN